MLPIGYGLEPETAQKYRKEWDMYIRFCNGRGIRAVPGRDKPWKIKIVRPYLEWRALTNNARSLTQIKCMLKHCGICYNNLLPTAAMEHPACLRIQLSLITRQVGKQAKKRMAAVGKSTAPKQSLALGKIAISLLFSAYRATTRKGFKACGRKTRHWLAMCIAMHTGCMRFELMRQLRKSGSFRWSQPDQCWRAKSDWHKMKRQSNEYAVEFPQKPVHAAMVYHQFANDGSVQLSFTAAQVLRWQMDIENSEWACDLFAPTDLTSAGFKKWIRVSFSALLVEDQTEVRALVEAMTPHSFRAGMASDLERENVPRSRIKRIGRWHSDRAMEKYFRDGLAQRLCRIRFQSIARKGGQVRTIESEPTTLKQQYDSSEGYDDEGESSEA